MDKRYLKSLGKEISLLGFGCMRLPRLIEERQDINCILAQKMIDRAIEMGVNYFDTAWGYHDGMSELFLGQALKKHPRNSFYLATKLPPWKVKSEQDIEDIFSKQLQNCQVDFFDFYLIHCLTKEYYKICQDTGIYDSLLKKKKQGLIHHLGFSFHDHPDLFEQIISDHEWDFAQIQLNYIDWEACDAKNLYRMLSERHIPAVIMEPIRGGMLASLNDDAVNIFKKADPDASVASWALRYAASLSNVMTVLSGMTRPEQLEDNLKNMTNFKPLSEDERKVIADAAKAYLASGTIPCTGCRYCMDCPSGVDIPRIFALYNHYCIGKSRIGFNYNYRSLDESEQAQNCIDCGKCLEHCPQNINIPEFMKMITEFVSNKE